MTIVNVLINTQHDFDWLKYDLKYYFRRPFLMKYKSVTYVSPQWEVAKVLAELGYKSRDLRYLDGPRIAKLPEGFSFVIAERKQDPLTKLRLLAACRKKKAALLNL